MIPTPRSPWWAGWRLIGRSHGWYGKSEPKVGTFATWSEAAL
ncbi:hypothetical protein [Streptomyces sp. MBT33]|nr:hypothetical protein [Streptomyces sp. MBT33]